MRAALESSFHTHSLVMNREGILVSALLLLRLLPLPREELSLAPLRKQQVVTKCTAVPQQVVTKCTAVLSESSRWSPSVLLSLGGKLQLLPLPLEELSLVCTYMSKSSM